VEVLREQSPFIATSKDGVTWTWIDFPGAPAVPVVTLSQPDSGPSVTGGCGDTVVSGTEECDPPNPSGGCSVDCRFVCLSGDPTRDCTPVDPCNGQASCIDATHICGPRAPLLDYTPCGSNLTMQCIGGVCSLR
jgi:hypothetical protein